MLLALLGVLLTLATGHTRTRRPGGWVTLTVIICNDDFVSKGSNLAELLTVGFDLAFIQEGKSAVYRDLRDPAGHRLLPYTTYGVHQGRRSPALSGSVVIWQHATFAASGMGFTFGVKARRILPRWIAWVRGRAGTCRMWVASAHWPPHRTKLWQPLFTAALWARTRLALAAGRLVLIGTDSNQPGGPPRLLPGLRWASATPTSIDGLIHSAAIRVVSVEELPKGSSDHHPQRFTIRVPL